MLMRTSAIWTISPFNTCRFHRSLDRISFVIILHYFSRSWWLHDHGLMMCTLWWIRSLYWLCLSYCLNWFRMPHGLLNRWALIQTLWLDPRSNTLACLRSTYFGQRPFTILCCIHFLYRYVMFRFLYHFRALHFHPAFSIDGYHL